MGKAEMLGMLGVFFWDAKCGPTIGPFLTHKAPTTCRNHHPRRGRSDSHLGFGDVDALQLDTLAATIASLVMDK